MGDIHTIQDIARSNYSDMLLDDERNLAYDQSIRKSVQYLIKSKEFNEKGQETFHCCDLGTGTGLLSMMIARAFLNENYTNFHVYAIECFQPSASSAIKTIEENNYSSYITVIQKNILELTCDDIPKVDLIVAELLDTELIGEDCINLHLHALKTVASERCLFVPSKARIFVELIQSNSLFRRNHLNTNFVNVQQKDSDSITSNPTDCPGNDAVDDVQLEALRIGTDFRRFTNPELAFEFSFNDPNKLVLQADKEITFDYDCDITEELVVASWWDLDMFDKARWKEFVPSIPDKIDLSSITCCPIWSKPKEVIERDNQLKEQFGRPVWRDHWMQSIYYFRNPSEVRKKMNPIREVGTLVVKVHHDRFSLWFYLSNNDEGTARGCKCGAHRFLSRSEISFLNDKNFFSNFVRSFLQSKADIDYSRYDTLLYGNESPRWEVLDSSNKQEKVYDLGLHNDIPWTLTLKNLLDGKTDWLITELGIIMSVVSFDNLYRTEAVVDNVMNFKMHAYKSIMNSTRARADGSVQSLLIWDYFSRRLQPDILIYNSVTDVFSSESDVNERSFHRKLTLHIPSSSLHKSALVFWSMLDFPGEDDHISTGPVSVTRGDIRWPMSFKQQVYFLGKHFGINEPINQGDLKNSANHREIEICVKLTRDKIYVDCCDEQAMKQTS